MKKSSVVDMVAECLVEPHTEDVVEIAEYIVYRLEKLGIMPIWEPENEQEKH